MNYLQHRERRAHGTLDFPFAYYAVSPIHPRYNMVHHWHGEYEIIRVLEGRLHLTLDGRRYVAGPGDIYFLPEGILHGGAPVVCLYECLVFDLHAVLEGNQICKKEIAPLLRREKQVRLHFSAADRETAPWVNRMMEAMKRREDGYRLQVLGALYSLLGGLLEARDWEQAPPVSGKVARRLTDFKDVLSLIKRRYQEDLTLDDLAACAGMNKKYFCRFFKEMTRYSPIDYLNYYRVESACEQLVTTEKNISEIAVGCGFNDTSYFTKVFRKYKGMTPTQYLHDSNW